MFHEVLQLVTHTKDTLSGWSGEPWFAWALFAILFAETGLVVTPFLPGDSLLFAVGAIAQAGKTHLSLPALLAVMCVAPLCGDAVNYTVGRMIGPRVFASETSRWLNRKHLARTQAFYEKYGAKTIVLARFVPIVRTFAPFIAGVGRMSFARFALFSVTGGIGWVLSLTCLGWWFGGLPFVEKNFQNVVYAIVVISVVPLLVEYVKARRAAKV
jgi:membrane-associated protein